MFRGLILPFARLSTLASYGVTPYRALNLNLGVDLLVHSESLRTSGACGGACFKHLV